MNGAMWERIVTSITMTVFMSVLVICIAWVIVSIWGK